jgi:hypothetical protein
MSESANILHKQRTEFLFNDDIPKDAIGIIPVIQLNFPYTEENGVALRNLADSGLSFLHFTCPKRPDGDQLRTFRPEAMAAYMHMLSKIKTCRQRVVQDLRFLPRWL